MNWFEDLILWVAYIVIIFIVIATYGKGIDKFSSDIESDFWRAVYIVASFFSFAFFIVFIYTKAKGI